LPHSPIVVTTEVTTRQITRIARFFKAQVVDNLMVGFKFMADVLYQLERTGAFDEVRGTPDDFVIATEESNGAMVTAALRDKDAAGAG
jgi:phosphoglucomutase/phosphomannomutase